MRISMVSVLAGLSASTGVDGRGVHVQELARALVRAGHEVVVHTRRDAPDQPSRQVTGDGVVVERLAAGPAGPLPTDGLLPYAGKFSRALADRLAAAPPDVLHAHSWVSGLAALAAARQLVPEPPLVQTFHALGSAEQQQPGRPDVGGPVRVRMERALARDVAAVIATSSEELQDLVRLGAPRHRVTVLPGGVDVELFS